MVREGHPFGWDHDGCRVVTLSLRVPVGKGHQSVGEKIHRVSLSGNRTHGVRRTVCIAADFTKDDTTPRYTGQGARCLISQLQSGW